MAISNLKIYNKGLDLVVNVYKLIRSHSQLSRDFSLCDQLKRASISVPTNISEGYLRSRKVFKNYLEISSGSANEMFTLLSIVSLVYEIDTFNLKEEYLYLAKQIHTFSNTILLD